MTPNSVERPTFMGQDRRDGYLFQKFALLLAGPPAEPLIVGLDKRNSFPFPSLPPSPLLDEPFKMLGWTKQRLSLPPSLPPAAEPFNILGLDRRNGCPFLSPFITSNLLGNWALTGVD